MVLVSAFVGVVGSAGYADPAVVFVVRGLAFVCELLPAVEADVFPGGAGYCVEFLWFEAVAAVSGYV